MFAKFEIIKNSEVSIFLIEFITFKKYLLIIIIPFVLAFVLNYIQIEIISSILIILISFAIYLKLKLLDHQDIESGLKIILPNNKVESIKIKIITYLKRMYLM